MGVGRGSRDKKHVPLMFIPPLILTSAYPLVSTPLYALVPNTILHISVEIVAISALVTTELSDSHYTHSDQLNLQSEEDNQVKWLP